MRIATPLIAILAAASLVVSGCSVSFDGPLITASDLKGDSVTEARDVDGFTSIEISGDADLVVRQGDEFDVTITTDSALLEHITTTVDDGELQVTQRYSVIGFSPDVVVAVTVPDLEGVELTGSSNADITGVTGDTLRIAVDGSADVSAEVAVETLSINISGSGDVTARGTATELVVEISGSGNVAAASLAARTARVEVSGSGEITVSASETLDASISGSGDVRYTGSPRVTSDVSGSGDVRPAGD